MTKELTIPNEPLGLENVKNSDLLFPRWILTQALSMFVQEGGKRPGEYINSLTQETVTDTSFVPVMASKYWDLLKPREGRMVFEARITDEHDERLKGRQPFRDGDKMANVNTVIAVIALKDGSPIVVPFTKSSYKAGKTLLTLAKLNGGPFFAHTYKLTAKKEVKGSNSYYVTEVSDLGATPQDVQGQAFDLYRSIAPKSSALVSAGLAGDAIEDVGF